RPSSTGRASTIGRHRTPFRARLTASPGREAARRARRSTPAGERSPSSARCARENEEGAPEGGHREAVRDEPDICRRPAVEARALEGVAEEPARAEGEGSAEEGDESTRPTLLRGEYGGKAERQEDRAVDPGEDRRQVP